MAISLRLDDKLSNQLAAAAKAKGVSKSELIRQCLDEYLNGAEQKPSAWELGKHLFGRYNSGKGDLSVRAHDIAREHVHAQRAKKGRR